MLNMDNSRVSLQRVRNLLA